MRPLIDVTGMYSGFLIGFSCWVLYAVLAATLLQRDSPNLHAPYDHSSWSFSEVARSIVDPVRPIFRNQALFLLAVLFTLVAFAKNGLELETQNHALYDV